MFARVGFQILKIGQVDCEESNPFFIYYFIEIRFSLASLN